MRLKIPKRINWLLSIMHGYRRMIFCFFILEVGALLMTLLFIYFSKRTIDIALQAVEGNLETNLILVVVFALLGVLLKTSSQWVNQRTQINMTLGFQYKVLERQMLSIWRVIKKWDTGDLLVRLNTDCQEIVQMLCNTWVAFIITCIKIIASFVFLFSMDSVLAIIILAITPLFLFAKLYLRRMRDLNSKVKHAESEIGSATQENLRFRIMLRALGVLQNRLMLYATIQKKYSFLRIKYLNFSLLSQGMMRTALSVGYLIAFTWGIYKLQSSEITFGTMTAFLQLVNQIQSPILALGSFFPALVRFRVAVDRVYEISNVEHDLISKGIKYDVIESVELDTVSFSYEDEIVVDKLTTNFNRGISTAILGASGKGKTTLIRLLLGLIKPSDGNISVLHNGVKSLLTSEHIINFSYVPQGNTLFKGTIRDNITLGLSNISDEQIKNVLFLSCAEFVHELDAGLDTQVGESGVGLSEGQAQRISIARAILRNSNVWIFDEATSALDSHTVNILFDRIKHLFQDKIVIFVTHDQNVAKFCDKQLIIN